MNFQFKDLAINISEALPQKRDAVAVALCTCTINWGTHGCNLSCSCTAYTNGCFFTLGAQEESTGGDTTAAVLLSQLRAELAADEADLVLV